MQSPTKLLLLVAALMGISFSSLGQQHRSILKLEDIAGEANTGIDVGSYQAKEPVLFTENRGQVVDWQGHSRSDILFTANGQSAKIFISATAIYYQLTSVEMPTEYTASLQPGMSMSTALKHTRKKISTAQLMTVSLVGANPSPVVRRELQGQSVENFYLAHCPAGITGVQTYGRLVFEDVYPGINWVLYSNGRQLKYDFVVQPGADPSSIRLQVNGADAVELTRDGQLVLKSQVGKVVEDAPRSFCGGVEVDTRFAMTGKTSFGFIVGEYNKAQALTIDPSVSWATYFGGANHEYAGVCMPDKDGNVYLAGITESPGGIASTGGFQTVPGGLFDGFLAKFDSTGARQWSTYYGGSDNDYFLTATLDKWGHIYAAGSSLSTTGIATAGTHQTNIAGFGPFLSYDACLVKFNSNGIRLWGTYYGGTELDRAYWCGADTSGGVYLAGGAISQSGISTPGSHQPVHGGNFEDGFLAKFDTAGTRQWGTYYGGNGSEHFVKGAMNLAGDIVLTGGTTSTAGIATAGSHQPVYSSAGGSNLIGMLVKFSSSGARQWGTYFPSLGFGCAVNDDGDAYLCGNTGLTTGISTAGSHQPLFGGGTADGFLAKFGIAGIRIWGTYYGGTGTDEGFGYCTTDPFGFVYAAGNTNSINGIHAGNGPQSSYGGGIGDATLVKFNGTGALQWGTYYGGAGDDGGMGCAVSSTGRVFLSGWTSSTTSIATPGSHQGNFAGGTWDAFLLKLLDTPSNTLTTGSIVPSALCAGSALSIPYTLVGTVNAGNSFIAQLSNAAGSFSNPTVIGSSASTLSGTIAATIPFGTTFGSSYRTRIISTSPAFIGANNGVNITIGQTPPGGISGPTPACALTNNQVYNVSPAAGATSYSWSLPTGWTGTSAAASISVAVGSGGGIISVIANGACVSSAPSSIAVSTVNTLPQPGPITGDDTVCAGASATYGVAPIAGAVSYLWSTPSAWSGSSTAPTLIATAGSGNGNITVSAVNACGSGPASALAVWGGNFPLYTPSVSITGPATGCSGQPQTFTATPTNGGTSPTYQWLKNGTTTGSNGSTFTSNALQAGDIISVLMTSNLPCAQLGPVLSNAITVTLSPTITPGINITVSPASTICAGSSVTFISNITGGGSTPTYQWFKNGLPVLGASASSFTDAAPTDGDSIYCVLASSAICAIPSSLASTKIGLTVLPAITPTVTVSLSPGPSITPGQTVTFTATAIGGGSLPSYQWMKNGQPISGATGPAYTTSALQSGDIITVQLTSNYACASVVQVSSAPLTIQISSSISATHNTNYSLSIIPNPAPGVFAALVDWSSSFSPGMRAKISLVDVLGRTVLQENTSIQEPQWSKTIGGTATLANGVYQLRISTDAGMLTAPVVIKR